MAFGGSGTEGEGDERGGGDDSPVGGGVEALPPDVGPRDLGAEEVHHRSGEVSGVEFVAAIGPDRLVVGGQMCLTRVGGHKAIMGLKRTGRKKSAGAAIRIPADRS